MEPRSTHGNKYRKYKKCLIMIIFICTKQNLSNIWGSIHENVKQHWGWLEKKKKKKKSVAYVKKRAFFRSRMKSTIKWRTYLLKRIQRYLIRPKQKMFIVLSDIFILWFCLLVNKCKNINGMNEKLSYTLHEHCCVYVCMYVCMHYCVYVYEKLNYTLHEHYTLHCTFHEHYCVWAIVCMSMNIIMCTKFC